MNPHSKKYFWRMTIGLIVYACGIWAMKYFYWKHSHSPYRYWLVLLPVLPMIYLILTFHRQLFEEKDEMWRKIITESLAFTATATAWTCCSFFFLRDLGAPTFHAEWVFFMMVAYYLIGFFFSWRRYK
jgi:FtsH-binding integral membrane protein